MAQQLFDDNGQTGLADDNGRTYFEDDNGNYWGTPPGNRRYKHVAFNICLALLVCLVALA